jgi:hypothetical protein
MTYYVNDRVAAALGIRLSGRPMETAAGMGRDGFAVGQAGKAGREAEGRCGEGAGAVFSANCQAGGQGKLLPAARSRDSLAPDHRSVLGRAAPNRSSRRA